PSTARGASASSKSLITNDRHTPKLIDIHHHITPPAYAAAMREHGFGSNIIFKPLLEWTLNESLEELEPGRGTTAITSLSGPGVWFGDAPAARRIARSCNEYAARLAVDYPGRFGCFATLPLPDVEGSLSEIAYALDILKVEGIGLKTSYDDKWLGHPAFDPIMEELNHRKAIVYTHPTLADCCKTILPALPPSLIEYGADTTRAIANLLVTKTVIRFPNIRFIFSHGGGTMPYLAQRFINSLDAQLPNGVIPELRRFYYDTAQAFHPATIAALTKLIPISQILFGTDFPYRTARTTWEALLNDGLKAEDLHLIANGNARRLLG
ncbi:MAG: amidohydrolase, partial [Sphingomonadaceae bacterium]|nr:amidohydrolase [Sphingomonadaceae bacterium]